MRTFYLLRRSWYFGYLRPVRCWVRFGHTWKRYEWTDKHGDRFVEEQCGRCLIERHRFALFCWRLTYRIKHDRWPRARG